MHVLAISGSPRAASVNTALLRGLIAAASGSFRFTLFTGLADLPVFSPDREGPLTPAPVLAFAEAVGRADGVVIACLEYVHTIPGGLKNAIDWLVSRDEIVGKPIALIHASRHRGDDMLADLRRVLATVSTGFMPQVFARFPLQKLTLDEVAMALAQPQHRRVLRSYLAGFAQATGGSAGRGND
jgi:chromate reductase, NAD(P)H dehydrogenase (quinone)